MMGAGIALGIAVGISIGFAIDNLAAGVGVGIQSVQRSKLFLIKRKIKRMMRNSLWKN